MKFLIALFCVSFLTVTNADVKNQNGPHHDPIQLYLQNNCYQEIFVALRYQKMDGEWESKGHMSLLPGEILKSVSLASTYYYLNAFTGDRRIRWEGEHAFEINGKYVRAAKVNIPLHYGGDWTTTLNCY